MTSYTLRRRMVEDLTVMARIIDSNTAAQMLFNEQEPATKVLATLKAQPRIVSARLFTGEGQVFASYARGDQDGPPPPPVLRGGRLGIPARPPRAVAAGLRGRRARGLRIHRLRYPAS